MKQIQIKHIIILLLSVFVLSSCRAKKKIFNGNKSLDCTDYDESSVLEKNKKSKWRIVLYKDGSRVGGNSKKGKSRLFRKKD